MSAEIIRLADRRPQRPIARATVAQQIAALAALELVRITLDHISAADWHGAYSASAEATDILSHMEQQQ